jgi:Trypsin-like peptidase domain
MTTDRPDSAKDAIVKVGDGRGFIVESRWHNIVITAAHCLPHLPPCHGAAYTLEKTYHDLLGPLDDLTPSIWAECLFVDPVADIAILGSPDDQEMPEQADAYDALTEGQALSVGEAKSEEPVWLLRLDGSWLSCSAKHREGPLWLEAEPGGIQGGMSGSPILTKDAVAVGVVCIGLDGPNPHLPYNLPGWFFRKQKRSGS